MNAPGETCISCYELSNLSTPPAPELRYLYEHHTAMSTFHSCRCSGTLPTACAKSQPTRQPCTQPMSSIKYCAVPLLLHISLLLPYRTIVLYSIAHQAAIQALLSLPPDLALIECLRFLSCVHSLFNLLN